MNARLPRKFAILMLVFTFFGTGCGNMPSFDTLFDDSPEALGTGITGVGLVRAVVIIAKYKATPRQREVATRRAQAAIARSERRSEASRPTPASAQPAPGKKRAAGGGTTAATPAPDRRRTTGPAPEPATTAVRKEEPVAQTEVRESEEPARSPQVAAAKKKVKLPRYIAVETEPDARARGEKSIMLYDTYAQEVVGNNVYDVESAPKMLQTAKFDTYAAQYVGTGSF